MTDTTTQSTGLTPVEPHGDFLLKRDDAYAFGRATGAKSRTMALHTRGKGILTAGTRISPQIERAALVARELGLPCRIHTSHGADTPEIRTCVEAGAEVLRWKPGYLSQIAKELRDDAAARPDWELWPFGMDRPEYLADVAKQVLGLPFGTFDRIVVPCGSGMTLAGILHGLSAAQQTVPVLGIQVGADPTERLDRHFRDWRTHARLQQVALDYDQPVEASIGTVRLDPHYEAKCAAYLQPRDLLWLVGCRQSLGSAATPPAPAQTRAAPCDPVVKCAHTRMVALDDLRPWPRNPNEHPPEQIRLLAKLMLSTGVRAAIVVSNLSGFITKGHGRLEAAKLAGFRAYPVDFQDYASEEEEKADVLADNLVADLATMNQSAMQTLLAELTAAGHDTELAGILQQQTDLAAQRKSAAGKLRDKFIVSPFTILDTRSGDWLERRKLWMQLGIASEVGREENLTFANSAQPTHVYAAKNDYEAKLGRKCQWDEFFDRHPDLRGRQNGTSIFNPVLCEIIYNWFLPSKGAGHVLDPFCGGSVRGIVAAFLGHAYTGFDIRAEQVEANIKNAAEVFDSIGQRPATMPHWIVGDATRMDEYLPPDARFDLVFTCPPYGDLEVYSDDPADLSAQPEDLFRQNYGRVIRSAVARLRPNRFSVWVVGDYRDRKTGVLRDFVSTTIRAHELPLYNHAVLLNAISSLAIRIGCNFPKARKLGKAHQDVAFIYNGQRLQLDAAAQAEVEEVVMCLNGQASKIPEALGPIGAREVIPLGDILAALTAPADAGNSVPTTAGHTAPGGESVPTETGQDEAPERAEFDDGQHCPKCSADAPDLEAAVATAGEFTCPACGHTTRGNAVLLAAGTPVPTDDDDSVSTR